MPRMKTLKPLRYAGRSLRAGESFDATDKHARLLAAIRSAALDAGEPAGQTAPVPEGDPDEHDERDEPQATDETPAKPKRKYKRRDMTAE